LRRSRAVAEDRAQQELRAQPFEVERMQRERGKEGDRPHRPLACAGEQPRLQLGAQCGGVFGRGGAEAQQVAGDGGDERFECSAVVGAQRRPEGAPVGEPVEECVMQMHFAGRGAARC
jgi:hypothetical protein